ncbi:hypothetical protein PIIN_10309 [Serendipita indica DSM 11827]|uniref:Uncharacterized protein n=1 Tax=Serendipita indica (strain DSM 11827) TaxID=1109443 RepID=G4TYC1_SERID|nr:hypothetical protein PIIN_10309 [Serendipita indica DSM 11827]
MFPFDIVSGLFLLRSFRSRSFSFLHPRSSTDTHHGSSLRRFTLANVAVWYLAGDTHLSSLLNALRRVARWLVFIHFIYDDRDAQGVVNSSLVVWMRANRELNLRFWLV